MPIPVDTMDAPERAPRKKKVVEPKVAESHIAPPRYHRGQVNMMAVFRVMSALSSFSDPWNMPMCSPVYVSGFYPFAIEHDVDPIIVESLLALELGETVSLGFERV